MDIPDLGYGYKPIDVTKTYVQRRRYDSPILVHFTVGPLVQFDEFSDDKRRLIKRSFSVEIADNREAFYNAELDLSGSLHQVKYVTWDRSSFGGTWIATRVRMANIAFFVTEKDELIIVAVEPQHIDRDSKTYPNQIAGTEHALTIPA